MLANGNMKTLYIAYSIAVITGLFLAGIILIARECLQKDVNARNKNNIYVGIGLTSMSMLLLALFIASAYSLEMHH